MPHEIDISTVPGSTMLKAEIRDGEIELDREFKTLTQDVERTALVLIFAVSIYLFLFQSWSRSAPFYIAAPVLSFVYGLFRRTARYVKLRRRIINSRLHYDEARRSLPD